MKPRPNFCDCHESPDEPTYHHAGCDKAPTIVPIGEHWWPAFAERHDLQYEQDADGEVQLVDRGGRSQVRYIINGERVRYKTEFGHWLTLSDSDVRELLSAESGPIHHR